jgi:ZIP family zinc transporter
VGAALGWGLLAGSSVLLGGWLTLRVPVSIRTLGLIMGFGSGVLISAVAYELVGEASTTADRGWAVALGLAAGCATFFVGDVLVDRMGGGDRKSSAGGQAAGSGLAIVLGIVLDGIPESVVIGVGLLEGVGVSAAMLVAVFLSNLPEAIAATSGLAKSGWKHSRIIWLWVVVTLVSGLSSLAGYAFLENASGNAVAFVLAFAGGAILTMLADTMMPEAFEQAHDLAGLITVLGFLLAFVLTKLER